MPSLNNEVLNQIKFHVRSGFFKSDDVEERVLEYFSNEPNRRAVRTAIASETRLFKSEMKDWQKRTDWDRLYDTFIDLADHWIIAIHNAGYTIGWFR